MCALNSRSQRESPLNPDSIGAKLVIALFAPDKVSGDGRKSRSASPE